MIQSEPWYREADVTGEDLMNRDENGYLRLSEAWLSAHSGEVAEVIRLSTRGYMAMEENFDGEDAWQEEGYRYEDTYSYRLLKNLRVDPRSEDGYGVNAEDRMRMALYELSTSFEVGLGTFNYQVIPYSTPHKWRPFPPLKDEGEFNAAMERLVRDLPGLITIIEESAK